MPGPVSDSNPGPSNTAPYVPEWCYPNGPRMCPCGHHEGYHGDSHGCPPEALYGDDGEMSCGNCAIDFKRWSATQIEEAFAAIGRRKLAAATDRADRCAFCPGEIPRSLCPPIGTFAICQGCADWLHANSRTAANGEIEKLGKVLQNIAMLARMALVYKSRGGEKDWQAIHKMCGDAWPAARPSITRGEPAEPAPSGAADPEDRPATRAEISRALQRTHEAFQRGPVGSPEYMKALEESANDGPPCESCGQPAAGRSADDVPLCSRCGKALAAEQGGKP